MRLIFKLLLLVLPTIANSQTCVCGPDYCQGDPGYPGKLAAKKQSLAARYPADLVALLDRDGTCPRVTFSSC
jgi:hypothetical protein